MRVLERKRPLFRAKPSWRTPHMERTKISPMRQATGIKSSWIWRSRGWRRVKASTMPGSNWRPLCALISSAAAGQGSAVRYGRSLVMASSASATAKIRAPIGMAVVER